MKNDNVDSSGSVTVWWEFQRNFDYFRYYAPFGAYSSASVNEPEDAVKKASVKDRTFEIRAATGSDDILYISMNTTRKEVQKSMVFYLLDGAVHDSEGYQALIILYA